MGKGVYIEKTCKKHGIVKFVLEGRGSYRCTKCRSNAVSRRRRLLKKQLVEHFGGKCTICGYNTCVDALQFHHLNPLEKEFGIAASGTTKSLSRMIKEATKCSLVCANCHIELHAEENAKLNSEI